MIDLRQVFEDDLVLTYAVEDMLMTNQNATLELGADGYEELPQYDVIFSQAGLFQLINIEKLGLTVMSDTGQSSLLAVVYVTSHVHVARFC